jgi:hypothetical protein
MPCCPARRAPAARPWPHRATRGRTRAARRGHTGRRGWEVEPAGRRWPRRRRPDEGATASAGSDARLRPGWRETGRPRTATAGTDSADGGGGVCLGASGGLPPPRPGHSREIRSAVKPSLVSLECPHPVVSSTSSTSPGPQQRVSPIAVTVQLPDSRTASCRRASGCRGCPPPAGARTTTAADAGSGVDTPSSWDSGCSGRTAESQSENRACPWSSVVSRRKAGIVHAPSCSGAEVGLPPEE